MLALIWKQERFKTAAHNSETVNVWGRKKRGTINDVYLFQDTNQAILLE